MCIRDSIKAVAIYRDGSKGTQPLNTSMDAKKEPSVLDAVGSRVLGHLSASQPAAEADLKTLDAHGSEKLEVSAKQLLAVSQAFQKAIEEIATAAAVPVLTATPSVDVETGAGEMPKNEQDLKAPPRAVRHRLQAERASITHKFSIAGHEGYITVGLYPNGQPGEIFIRMAKEGSTVSGLMDVFATSVSLALQHGVCLLYTSTKYKMLWFVVDIHHRQRYFFKCRCAKSTENAALRRRSVQVVPNTLVGGRYHLPRHPLVTGAS